MKIRIRAGLSRLQFHSKAVIRDYDDLEIPAFDGCMDSNTRVLNLNAWKETSQRSDHKLSSILMDIFGVFKLTERRVGLVITGTRQITGQALSLLKCTDRLCFNLDVDVFDPGIMPVSFPVEDGIGFEEMSDFLSVCLDSKRFLGISIAFYHPDLDPKIAAGKRLVEHLAKALFPGA